MNNRRREFEGDAGAPMPNLSAPGIHLSTVAPALGVPTNRQPDYLDYDQKGRGIVVTMFANAGMSYCLGIGLGGAYGIREGMIRSPSSRARVKLNSVLNHSGRFGSRVGNALGVVSILYSLYEGAADHVSPVHLTFLLTYNLYCLNFLEPLEVTDFFLFHSLVPSVRARCLHWTSATCSTRLCCLHDWSDLLLGSRT